jgi:hypothetical protein
MTLGRKQSQRYIRRNHGDTTFFRQKANNGYTHRRSHLQDLVLFLPYRSQHHLAHLRNRCLICLPVEDLWDSL